MVNVVTTNNLKVVSMLSFSDLADLSNGDDLVFWHSNSTNSTQTELNSGKHAINNEQANANRRRTQTNMDKLHLDTLKEQDSTQLTPKEPTQITVLTQINLPILHKHTNQVNLIQDNQQPSLFNNRLNINKIPILDLKTIV
jgi:hypothetical protein